MPSQDTHDLIQVLALENRKVRADIYAKLEKHQQGYVMSRDDLEKYLYQLSAFEILAEKAYASLRLLERNLSTFGKHIDEPHWWREEINKLAGR